MKGYDEDRRQFLKIAISLPAAFIMACESKPGEMEDLAPLLNPEESLKKLILLMGPWSDQEKKQAENFAERFIKQEHAGGQYLNGSSKLIQNLASRFSGDKMAVKNINLAKLPDDERVVLINLVKQIYSLIEVRFYVSKEPPWGECQGSNTWHTRIPAEG
jgi:hypothetical protein